MSKTAFITGANGHLGHALIPKLKEKGYRINTYDISDLSADIAPLTDEQITGDILDFQFLTKSITKDIDVVFHLAGSLAVVSELNPEEAHAINATGSLNVYKAALLASELKGISLQVIFPSSISVYGLPDVVTKNSVVVTEDEYINPLTIYGITKLYSEQIGIYFSERYNLLNDTKKASIDFRAVRLPGVITGFESKDQFGKYAGLTMIHAPIESGGFEVYVREDSILPFININDAATALIFLSETQKEKLTRRVYNISGFASTVKEMIDTIKKEIPEANPTLSIDPQRQSIVDSWPQAIDDSQARNDWGWS